MTRIALITTTINVPTVLTQWASRGMTEDDVIIVAGDQKSPINKIEDVLTDIHRNHGIRCVNLHPLAQEVQWRALSDAIGWNCIQRRNFALLAAMELRPEYILTVDDDNFPTSPRQVEQLLGRMDFTDDLTKVISTSTYWYNPGRQCLTDDMRTVTHRGFPLSQRHVKPFYIYETRRPPVAVAAMLWTGDPDIDAAERIVNRPNVTRITEDVVLQPGTWAPFNTQATMIRGEFAPALFMFPHVGRYDDIWASYVFRKIADNRGYGAFYGRPAVHQDRNEHDLIKDLQAEMFGMRMNEHVIEVIRGAKLRENDTVVGDVAEIYVDLLDTGLLGGETARAMHAWMNALEELGWAA